MAVQLRTITGKVDPVVELLIRDLVNHTNSLESALAAAKQQPPSIISIPPAVQALTTATTPVPPGSGITQLTGDGTAGPGSGSQVLTLANSGVAAGTYGDSTHVAQVTIDIKGRVTTAADVAIANTGITQLTGDVTAGPGSGSQAATIANAAVTLAKIQNATANSKLIGSGSSGSGASYSEISLGSGLSMSSTTLNASASGGASVALLEQHTASSSASLDFTSWYSSTYDDYFCEIIGILPANDGVNLLMKVSTDGGSTWSATGYHYGIFAIHSGNSTATAGSDVSTIGILVAQPRNVANAGVCGGWVRIFAPGSSTRVKVFQVSTAFWASDSHVYNWHGPGMWDSTTAINGVQFYFQTGNIAEGTIRLYGIAKS